MNKSANGVPEPSTKRISPPAVWLTVMLLSLLITTEMFVPANAAVIAVNNDCASVVALPTLLNVTVTGLVIELLPMLLCETVNVLVIGEPPVPPNVAAVITFETAVVAPVVTRL